MENSDNIQLPPKPDSPNKEDCCQNNCELCVFEVYNRQVAEWERLCKEIKQKEYTRLSFLPSALSQTKYCPFNLISVSNLTHDTKLYRFKVIETETSVVYLNINLGQHLIMKLTRSDGNIITRAYTPLSDNTAHAKGCFEVLVKLYSGGEMSEYIRNLSVGDTVFWRGAFGSFQYLRNKFKHILMCCAGTGVAPMWRIVKTIVEDHEEETFVRLLVSYKKNCDVLLRKELSQLASYWNFSYSIFVTRDEPEKIYYGECVVGGRISQEIIQCELAERPLLYTLVLICGTVSFCTDVKAFVKETGVEECNVFVF